jgi:L-rhamnonate dehydratase
MAGAAAVLRAAPLTARQAPAVQLPERRSGSAKITAIEVLRVEGRREGLQGASGQRQANPAHIYDDAMPPLFRESPAPTKTVTPINGLYLKIRADQGLEGLYGPIDTEPAIIIHRQLRNLLVGKDALSGELLWDQMHRSNRHSRRGHFMMAISAVDNALWDLRGRYFGVPVYRLLGGPTRQNVEAYGSCLGYSQEPESLRKRVAIVKGDGYRYMKWFAAYGPAAGPQGMKANVDLVRNLREAAGEDMQIMIDAFSGWDLTYALEWCRKVEPYRLHWIEEAFSAEKIESFAQLRRSISFPVASGEHFYGRWEVHDYLKAGALDVVQADPEWCGGVSELVKICTVASTYDVQVIPHGHRLHAALHVAASQSPMTCPMVEYLIVNLPRFHHFEKNPLAPVNGRIALPDRPGFGIELDPTKVEKQMVMEWG